MHPLHLTFKVLEGDRETMRESKNGTAKKYILLVFALCFATVFGVLLGYNLMTGVKK